MASAYKGAIAIYASRALSTHCDARSGDGSRCVLRDCWVHGKIKHDKLLENIVDLSLRHLQQISPRDSHFKGILWPCFIIGAEARLPEQRSWIANALEQLYGMIHMWNIKRGLSVLHRLWARPFPAYENKSWLEEVYDMDEKLVLI